VGRGWGYYAKFEVFRLLGLLDPQDDGINVLRNIGTYWQFDYQSTGPTIPEDLNLKK